MSSAHRFSMLVDSAYRNNDIESAKKAYYDYQVSNCYHPIRQRIYDAHTMQYRYIDAACGRCYHCTQSKINEWVTRMYSHAEDFKNVYFVTLTYKSFKDLTDPIDRLIINKLSQAVWHFDSFNSTKSLAYNPCLLVKKHYQDFLKRLRRNTGFTDITYVLSGEYGHRFGRPHYHLILFSNNDITADDIQKAWSLCLFRKYDGSVVYKRNHSKDGESFYVPIGNIDFHNLVENGSFNTTTKIKVDGSFMNAANCFSYVCKYVCKRDKANVNRVILAYNNLYHTEEFVKVYSNEVQYNIISDYLSSVGYPHEKIEDVSSELKKYKYEKFIYQPTSSVFSQSLAQYYKKNLFGTLCDFEYFPPVRKDFIDSYLPFCEFSRGTPIGSVYAESHLQEFKEGVYNKPILQDSSFVVPSYFRRKAQDSLFGLRQSAPRFGFTSFRLGALPNLYRRFQEYDQNEILPIEHIRSKKRAISLDAQLHRAGSFFKDCSTGERVVLRDEFAVHFKYDRHKRKFVFTREMPLHEWIRIWCVNLSLEFTRHADITRISHDNMRLRESSMLKLTDMGVDTSELVSTFLNNTDAVLNEQNKLYDEVHHFVE